jgi:predicted GNAT superfamily acetyltransferase
MNKKKLVYDNLNEHKQVLSNTQSSQIIDLNNSFQKETGELSNARLLYFNQYASHILVASTSKARPEIIAFAIAIQTPSRFTHPFFSILSQNFPHFIFIERIIVHPEHQRLNIASSLIAPLIAQSAQHQIPLSLTVNHIPPNLPALNFALSRLKLKPIQQSTVDDELSVTTFAHTFSEEELSAFQELYTPKKSRKNRVEHPQTHKTQKQTKKKFQLLP